MGILINNEAPHFAGHFALYLFLPTESLPPRRSSSLTIVSAFDVLRSLLIGSLSFISFSFLLGSLFFFLLVCIRSYRVRLLRAFYFVLIFFDFCLIFKMSGTSIGSWPSEQGPVEVLISIEASIPIEGSGGSLGARGFGVGGIS